ncbi:MAG TPA: TA system VapC family ribonuclease toxin [Rhizomicrobium sp.]|nr:TA system VapC family ribonuclease toxin [Rhizomicrobium sp.]
MTVFLLDVNVLVALIDPSHIHHDGAHEWFAAEGQSAWATCPLVENGVLRVVGHPRYPNSPGSPAAVAQMLRIMCELPGHVFWPDDVSVLDAAALDTGRLLASSQVTDTYLLALARAHNGKLASFDRRLVVDAITGGARYLHAIP